MAHSENSNMIKHYIGEFEAERITLSGLWYNIQTPLHILFQKEELLHVQEERLKEVKSYNVMWQTEYKQKEAALAHFVQFSNALKAEIVELKKQQEYWYDEKVAQEKKELALKAEISDLKDKLDSLKELFLHNEEAESCEYENKETALRAEISDLKDELDSLKAEGVGLSNDEPRKSSSHISPNSILVAYPASEVTHKHQPYSYHAGSDTKCHELGTTNAVLTIDEALKVASRSKTVKGFSYNTKTKTAWFHWEINPDKVISESNCRPGQKKYKWHHLYIIN